MCVLAKPKYWQLHTSFSLSFEIIVSYLKVVNFLCLNKYIYLYLFPLYGTKVWQQLATNQRFGNISQIRKA